MTAKTITGTSYGRQSRSGPAKMDISQMIVPVGVGGLTQSEEVSIEGVIRTITVGVNDNTNNVTVTINIIDEDGAVLFTLAALAEATASAPTVIQIMNDAGVFL